MYSIFIFALDYRSISCYPEAQVVPVELRGAFGAANGRGGKSMNGWELPPAQGLYDPAQEHDACGVGFVVDIQGRVSRSIVEQSLTVLKNLLHRGACGCETNTGDGAGNPG